MSKKFTNPDDKDKEREEVEKRLKLFQEEKKKREKEKEKEKPENYTIYPKHFIDDTDNNNNNNNTNINSNIDLNNKIKRKRSETSKVFDDVEDQTLITHVDKTFLDLKQQELTKEFLQKYADNDNLYVFTNIYEQKDKETFILLNLPQDKEAFNNFITSTYKPFLTSQHGIMDYTN
jgi:hypothetical protein